MLAKWLKKLKNFVNDIDHYYKFLVFKFEKIKYNKYFFLLQGDKIILQESKFIFFINWYYFLYYFMVLINNI